ncbi:MAG TPA: nuclear transport factor 2 family protein [Cyclobacteriaceae bacterium]|nr:nuclear transport factor 2 family protein [Cyclobacteriaceae bacterium]
MIRHKILLIILFAFHFYTALCQANSSVSENTLTHLKKFRTHFSKSMLDENPEMIQSYFADDIRLMPEFQKTIITKANVTLYWKLFGGRFDTQEFNRTETEIIDIGSRIVEIGSFSSKMKSKSDGKVFELKGKYLDLWEKRGDQILLLTQAWNYDYAINFGDQLKFPEVPSVIVAYEPHVPIDNPIRFELAAINDFMETVISQRDSKIWSQFYADDASWLYTANSIVQGRKSLDDFFERHAKELPIFEKLNIRNDRIDDFGKYVVEYASHVAIIRNGDFSGIFTGKDLVLWRREPNGSLKIFKHIGMYD